MARFLITVVLLLFTLTTSTGVAYAPEAVFVHFKYKYACIKVTNGARGDYYKTVWKWRDVWVGLEKK